MSLLHEIHLLRTCLETRLKALDSTERLVADLPEITVVLGALFAFLQHEAKK